MPVGWLSLYATGNYMSTISKICLVLPDIPFVSWMTRYPFDNQSRQVSALRISWVSLVFAIAQELWWYSGIPALLLVKYTADIHLSVIPLTDFEIYLSSFFIPIGTLWKRGTSQHFHKRWGMFVVLDWRTFSVSPPPCTSGYLAALPGAAPGLRRSKLRELLLF